MYSVGMMIQCFTIDGLHRKLGSKQTYILGTSLGAVVALMAVYLNYADYALFIAFAVTLRVIDGARETQFEVVTFVYFAEKVLEGTTEAMQGKAISIYKAVGSVGFLFGAIQGPLFLTKLGYDGSWCVFLATYIVASTLAYCIYPSIQK